MPRQPSPGARALLYTLLALLAGWTALHTLPSSDSEIFALPGMFNSSHQQRAHKLFLVVVAGLAALQALGLLDRLPAGLARPVSSLYRAVRALPVWLVAGLAALLMATVYGKVGRDQYLLGMASAVLLVLAARFRGLTRSRPLALCLWLVLLGLTLVFTLTGLLAPLTITPFDSGVDRHLYALYGPANALFFTGDVTQAVFRYGMLWPVVGALLQKLSGPFSLGDHLRFTQVLQAAFILLSLAALYLRSKARPGLILVAAMLFLPFVHTLHPALVAANESAVRFIGFPLGLLALALALRMRGLGAAALLGAVSGVCVLCNIETGLCLGLGLLAATVTRTPPRQWKSAVPGVLIFLLAFAAALAALLLLFSLLFGVFPLRNILYNLRLYTSGAGGLPLEFSLLALLLFCHATYGFIALARTWGRRGLNAGQRFSFAVFGVMLLWFAYYAYRPNPWMLWSEAFLYAFAIQGVLASRWLAWNPAAKLSWRTRLTLPAVAFILVLWPLELRGTIKEVEYVRQRAVEGMRAADNPAFAPLSGVYLPAPAAQEYGKKTSYLREHAGEHPLYFTTSSFILPVLMEQMQPFPLRNLHAESPFQPDLERNIAGILRAGANVILLDDEDGAIAYWTPGEKRYYDILRSRLAENGYRLAETASGWQVWQRNGGTAP